MPFQSTSASYAKATQNHHALLHLSQHGMPVTLSQIDSLQHMALCSQVALNKLIYLPMLESELRLTADGLAVQFPRASKTAPHTRSGELYLLQCH